MALDPDRALRVLMVMHMQDSRELGGARVQLELADELRAKGCEVRVLARDEILAGRRPGRFGVSPDAFVATLVGRVREMAHDYDIIDAHQGNIPVSKKRLGFDGLMVTRSVGLIPFYSEFARTARRRWPEARKGHPLVRPMHRWRALRTERGALATFRLCDLISVSNAEEKAYLADHLGLGEKTVVLGLGIEDERLRSLGSTVRDPARTTERIAFIGDWSARKGAHDWPEIIAGVLRRVPGASFAFLGTHVPPRELASTLGLADSALDVVPTYPSGELGKLLDGVRVGALPSYIEGFGLGVLEQMAAGIPSVCYDVPGPRETIGRVDPHLLAPVGDTAVFAERLIELIELDDEAYHALSARCRAVAEQFSWRLIGAETLSIYRDRLARLRAPESAG